MERTWEAGQVLLFLRGAAGTVVEVDLAVEMMEDSGVIEGKKKIRK